jgi:lipase chaperone LimK
MTTCIVAGTCTNQVATYAADQQALTQEKMTIWQNLFASAPNKAQATSVLNQMTALNAQKHALMQQIFSSAKGSATPLTGGPQTEQ